MVFSSIFLKNVFNLSLLFSSILPPDRCRILTPFSFPSFNSLPAPPQMCWNDSPYSAKPFRQAYAIPLLINITHKPRLLCQDWLGPHTTRNAVQLKRKLPPRAATQSFCARRYTITQPKCAKVETSANSEARRRGLTGYVGGGKTTPPPCMLIKMRQNRTKGFWPIKSSPCWKNNRVSG